MEKSVNFCRDVYSFRMKEKERNNVEKIMRERNFRSFSDCIRFLIVKEAARIDEEKTRKVKAW